LEFEIADFDTTRRYEFRITNGASDGTHRVNQVSLDLNGRELMNASDVTSTVAFAVKLAEPLESNEMTVSVKGPVNSYILLDLVSMPDPSYRIHGLAQYTRAASPAGEQVFDGEFERPSTANSPYALILTNGSPDGSQRVTSGSLYLNG
jgi:hypothetical protein